MKTTRQIYCQYLLSSQINYTCTNLADHVDHLDHNSVYRYLKNERLTPRLIWEKARETLEQTAAGYIIFDDTVADKSHSRDIEGVRRQYSGNAGGIIKGIGIVTCVYYNAARDRFWVIDYRVFDPDRDGKTKLDHVRGDARFDCAARHRVLERADGQLVCHDRLDEQTHQSRKTVLLSDKAQPASG
ncbi:MAG: transposase [Pyrinomonadaceae bacterium]